MKTIISAFLLLWTAEGYAQQPPPDARETLSRLARSAEEELERSNRELNELREKIENEKLPLSKELTTLEQSVTTLRKEHDRVTRLVDVGNLEIPAIKAEMKARNDELAYIGTLLDEYVRSLEGTVHVSELQTLGPKILEAKQATEEATLPMPEKFSRQTAFANLSVKRLFEVVGGMRFPGIGVDVDGTVADGQFAIIGPVVLFRAKSGQAGIVVPQTGSDKPLIRPLEGEMQTGLSRLVQDGEGSMPLDPSLGGALKALVQKTNLFHIFEKGGPIMWPLLAASVLALAVVLERILFLLMVKRRRDPKRLGHLLGELERGDANAAVNVGRGSKDFVVRAMTYALGHKEQSLSHALIWAQQQELKRFRRGIPVLDTVITLAPLLGLLGTVTGMMGSFSLLGGEDLGAPGAITGGIAEALIATAFGLGIAITALIPFNMLNARTEEARHDLDSAATQVELLVQPQQKTIHWAPQRQITALRES
jgi:biopolymer transport protein ExbB